MYPYDASFNALPHDPITVLRSFASIEGHPDRGHIHAPYKLKLTDEEIIDLCDDSLLANAQRMGAKCDKQKRAVQKPKLVLDKVGLIGQVSNLPICFSSIVLPPNYIPAKNVDSNDPYAMLDAFPMKVNGAKQVYDV